MAVDRVTETMAFACSSLQWWSIVRGDPARDLGIGGEDREAFDAARRHVLESTAEMLLYCRKAFATKARHPTRYTTLRTGKLVAKTVAKNAWWELELIGASTKRSALCVSCEADSDGTVKLWASITGPDVHLQWLEANQPIHGRAEAYCYSQPVAVEKDQMFSRLAADLAGHWWPVVAAYCERVNPGSRAPKGGKP